MGQAFRLLLGNGGLFLISFTPGTEAAFVDDGWGARPVGMGGFFTAIADDSNAALYNPAGIVQAQ